MADYMSEEEQSPQVASKQKKSSEHQWTDSDARDLIYMWQQEKCLYNTRNKDYHNTTKRSRAIERISVEIHVPSKEFTKKTVGLRSYYGQLKQKVNLSKKVELEQMKFFSRNGLFMTIIKKRKQYSQGKSWWAIW